VTASAIRFIERIATTALAFSVFGMLASCGSGAVSDSSGTGSGAITVSPSSATLYSELPTTFVISGGNGNYVVTSSNQAVIGFSGVVSSNTLTVIPSSVGADTPVTMTVTDTAGHTGATASLTVKPRTVSNVVTVTPSAGQPTECGTAVCSGGDAEVKVTLTLNGVPLVGRTVRFDVLSGDLRIITSAAGSSETLSTSGTTTTDSSGTARMRVRVLANAPNQTALLQITDQSSGFVQTTAVGIAQASNSPLTVRPATIQFTGPNSSSCANGVSADIVIVGGRPPYQVTQPAGFIVAPTVVTSSGSRVTVTATGQCARTAGSGNPDAGQTISIIDSSSAVASVVVHNDPAPVTGQSAPFTVAPASVTLDSCNAYATIALAGGTGPSNYIAASGHNAVTATINGNGTGQIYRTRGTTISTSPVHVAFSDGQTIQDVTVNLTGLGLGTCP
jgi:hypothetical protein